MVKRYEKIIHLAYWIWLIFSPAIQWYLWREPIKITNLFKTLAISQFFIGVVIFYFQYLFVMPRLFTSKWTIRTVIGWSFVSLLGYIVLRYTIEEVLFPYFWGIRNYGAGTTLTYYIFDNIYYGGKYIVVSSLIWLVVHNAEIIEAKNALQKQQSEAEINFLRAQINPHFLFNTINNIYSLVYHQSEKSLPAIQKLGELMRYMTTELAKEKVELTKEIDYLKSFIDLNALRYSGGGAITLNISGNAGSKTIAPFLLLPFVENAFKHGVADEKADPICIDLSIEPDHLTYTCRNKIKFATEKTEGTGTGLNNLQRRLNLLYPESYFMKTELDGEHYYAQLKLYFT